MTTPVPLLTTPLPEIGQDGEVYAANSDRLMRELPVSLTGFNASLLEFDANALQAESDKDDAATAATTAAAKALEAAASAAAAESATTSARAEILQANLGDYDGGVYGNTDGENKVFVVLGLDWSKPVRLFVDGKIIDKSTYIRSGNVITLDVAPIFDAQAFGFVDPLDIAPAGYKTIRIETTLNGSKTITCTSNGATPKWLDDDGNDTTSESYTFTNDGSAFSIRLFVPDDATILDMSIHTSNIKRIVSYETITIRNIYAYTNQLSDISGMSHLRFVGIIHLASNQIRDISPLSKSRPLWAVYLTSNLISDLSPIADWRPHSGAYIDSNNIADVSPVFGWRLTGTMQLNNNKIIDPLNIDAIIGWAANDAVSLAVLSVSGGTNAAPTFASCADQSGFTGRGGTLITTTMSTPCQ